MELNPGPTLIASKEERERVQEQLEDHDGTRSALPGEAKRRHQKWFDKTRPTVGWRPFENKKRNRMPRGRSREKRARAEAENAESNKGQRADIWLTKPRKRMNKYETLNRQRTKQRVETAKKAGARQVPFNDKELSLRLTQILEKEKADAKKRN